MGLDQYFYKRKPHDFIEEEEVAYFRKHWRLHDEVIFQTGEPVENGKCVLLDRDVLDKLIIFLRDTDYWAKHYEEEDDLTFTNGYIKAAGAFALYDELWYCPDW